MEIKATWNLCVEKAWLLACLIFFNCLFWRKLVRSCTSQPTLTCCPSVKEGSRWPCLLSSVIPTTLVTGWFTCTFVQAGSLMFSLRLPSPDLSVSHASAFHFRSLELPAFKISVAVHALCLFPVQNWLRATEFQRPCCYTLVLSSFIWAVTAAINFL